MKKQRGRKRKGIFRDSSGVTLFEVMIALAFFAIIITPVMRTFVSSIKTNKESREVMTATDVATTIMEGITSKSYEEAALALRMACTGGFHTPTSETDSTANAKYAFSSINDNYYNEGGAHVAPNCLTNASDLTKYQGNYSTTLSVPESTNCVLGEVDDLSMCAPAISHLHTIFGDNPDASSFPILEDEHADSPDKMLYVGFSSTERYADTLTKKGVAKCAYMLYTGIKKNNMYFDATVTFVPRAENKNSVYTGGTNTENAEFFVYEVTVKVYPYRFDPRTGTWVERFDPDTGTFDGAPAAIMKSGIPNKNLNE
ncbi:MAG: hypothetical protein K5697_16550 [Lachnospiraceae bacterium]|nr:hypothetical protein [Lachnospiraceae bacterium]